MNDRPESAEAFAYRLEREHAEEFKARKSGKQAKPPAAKKKRRTPIEATELNIWQTLRTEDELHTGKLFKLDTFSGQTMMMHPIPIPDIDPPKVWTPREVTDISVGHMMVWLQAHNFKKVSVSRVSHAIDMEAERNSFSSAKQWLLGLPKWDKERRLDHFWVDVCGVSPAEMSMSKDDAWRLLSAIARCFFIGIVARIMQPGCKADFSPVLEGPQGIKKSMLLRIIAINPEWFSDCMPRDLANKDARSHLAGKLIVELAEMHQMKATQVDTLKGFLTVQEDKFRPSYGRRDITLKRQCCFIGTTNRSDYFHDETGNRRFWPIACGDINIELAKEIMPQLYAEAFAAYLADEQWWLLPEVEMLAEVEQDNRITNDPWEEGVAVVVGDFRNAARTRGETFFYVTSVQGLQGIESDRTKWDEPKQGRVARIMRKLGGKNMKLPRGAGWPKCGYRFVTDDKRGK